MKTRRPANPVGDPVLAMDKDAIGNQETLFYELEAKVTDDDDNFVIDSATGQISVDDNPVLDYDETDPIKREYQLTVKATDPSAESSTADVTIQILNVDEPPEITASDGTEGLEQKTPKEVDSSAEQGVIADYVKDISIYRASDDDDGRTASM